DDGALGAERRVLPHRQGRRPREEAQGGKRPVRLPPLPREARLRQRNGQRARSPAARVQPRGRRARLEAHDGVLRQEPALVVAGTGALAALTALAWLYVWRGAGMGMSALDMTTVALFPHLVEARMPGMSMGGMDAPVIGWTTVVAMWW